MHRKKGLKRTQGLKRTPIRNRNAKRQRRVERRNFGGEADAVRAMPCLCIAAFDRMGWRAAQSGLVALGLSICTGKSRAAHVTARGMGAAKGGRFDIGPLCDRHHAEAGEAGTSQRAEFEKRWGIDLRLEADRIALEHAAPLGLRTVARRWTAELAIASFEVEATPEQEVRDHGTLSDYEWKALLGWTRRRMELWSGRLPYIAGRPDREGLAHAVMLDLGEPFTLDPEGEYGIAWDLCEAAGWPQGGPDA